MTLSRSSRRGASLRDFALSAAGRRKAFILFFVMVALIGGGSRGDIRSLILLRPMAVLFGAYAICVMPPGQLRPFRPLVWLLFAAAAVVAWQIVPLPPALWQALPTRGAIAEVDALLGHEGLWRAAALSPAGAWNALFSLAVPAATLLVYAALDPDDREVVVPAIVLFACVSAGLGVFQMLTDPNGALYLYDVTNAGLPVGLFANRNHQAIFLAAAIPALALWADIESRRGAQMKWAAVGLGVALLIVIVVAGSRAGLLVGIPAAVIAAFTLHSQSGDRTATARPASLSVGRRRIVLGFATLALIALLVVIALSARVLPFELAAAPDEELRFRALPALLELVAQLWPVGSGGGGFALAYQRVEPIELLSATYLNNAHNDWLQVIIELGLPGLAVLAGFLYVLLGGSRFQFAGRARSARWPLAAILSVPVVFAVTSIVDYPLRTPSLAMVAMLWFAALTDRDSRVFRARSAPGSSLRQAARV